MSSSISVGVGDLPCFPTFCFYDFKILKFSLYLFVYFFVMTGEPMRTTSKERMVPEVMFSTERIPQL